MAMAASTPVRGGLGRLHVGCSSITVVRTVRPSSVQRLAYGHSQRLPAAAALATDAAGLLQAQAPSSPSSRDVLEQQHQPEPSAIGDTPHSWRTVDDLPADLLAELNQDGWLVGALPPGTELTPKQKRLLEKISGLTYKAQAIRLKISISNTNRQPPNKGKPWSEGEALPPLPRPALLLGPQPT